jgi:hypothetical protein
VRGLLAPLSPNEETALRRVAFGTEGELEPLHLRRLVQLELVEWSGGTWRLTALGQRRHDALAAEGVGPLKPAA